jgi:hypothetical protein
MHCGSTSVILEEVKQFVQSIRMESDEMQDPTYFARNLFDKLDGVFQQSNSLNNLLPNIF